jgi:2-methylcitrate dehydratase PrpD
MAREVAMEATTYADRLAEFSVGLSVADIPAPVLRQAEISTMDYLGVVLAGGVTPVAQAVRDHVLAMGGAPEATLFGTPHRAPSAMAAMANGTRAHSIELDDHEAHMRSKVHPGAVVLPAAWAVAETRPVSGADFLAAVVVGYDVFGRLSGATSYADFLGKVRGYHTTPLFGPFASAATAARLLGLSAEQLSNAFGIAGSLCSGLQETVRAGAMVKPFHAGWAAQSGLVAAQLAARGFTGPRTIFEGKKGFFQAFCGEGNYTLSVIDHEFGVDFDISLIMYKPYACGGGIHPTLTAIDDLRGAHSFEPGDVESVVVRTSQQVVDAFCTPYDAKVTPRSGPQAQHSLPYAVAALIHDGAALIDQFSDAAVGRAEVLSLAAKVRVEVDDSIVSDDPEDEPAGVAIVLGDGRVLETRVRGGRGSLTVPMSEDELVEKYLRLATPSLGRARAVAVKERALSLRADPDVSTLPGQLQPRESVG